MKSLTLVGAKGTFEVLTSTTLTELATWLDSMPKALAAFNILLKMEHTCDSCGTDKDVSHTGRNTNLCSTCSTK